MLTTENETVRSLIQIFQGSEHSVYLLDRQLCCIWGNNDALLQKGESVRDFIRGDTAVLIAGSASFSYYRRGSFYCARIESVYIGTRDVLYLCELINRADAADIAQKTDCIADTLPFCTTIESCINGLWKGVKEIGEHLPDDDPESTALTGEINRLLFKLSSAEKNLLEYTYMAYSPSVNVVFDVGKLCSDLVERCCTVLAKCGRTILFSNGCGDKLYICADSRRAVTALVDAIQNALLYSPRDTVPVMTVQRIAAEGRSYAEIRLVNEELIFPAEYFSSQPSLDYGSKRTGLGLAVIERFALLSGGSFEMTCSGDKTTAVLTLPEATAEDITRCRLEDAAICAEEPYIPDIAELKMREVAELYGIFD